MRRLDPCLAPAGYSPRRYETLSPAPVLGMGERMTDLRDIQALFANGEQGGYWPADPAYAYEDSAGTILASRNGVVGYRTDVACGKHAIQATTANKPYRRTTPSTGKYWYDSNTATGALNVTFPSAMGRRNLLTYTEDFSNTFWYASNVTKTIDGIITTTNILNPGVFYSDGRSTLGSMTRVVFSVSLFAVTQNYASIQMYANGTGLAQNVSVVSVSGPGNAVVSGAFVSVTNLDSVTPTRISVAADWLGDISPYIKTLNSSTAGVVGGSIKVQYPQFEIGSAPTEYQKIVSGESSALDPAALAATHQQNITAATNCTIACVTPEGVVIADNQTVGTTYNIAPPYGYNSDVLIINRALTAAEKALVTRVMQRNVPTLGSNLIIDPDFDSPALWTTEGNAAVSGGCATFTNAVSGDGTCVRSTNDYSFSTDIFYWIKIKNSSYSSGQLSLARYGFEVIGGFSLINDNFMAKKMNSIIGTKLQLYQVWNGSNLTVSVDSLSIKGIF